MNIDELYCYLENYWAYDLDAIPTHRGTGKPGTYKQPVVRGWPELDPREQFERAYKDDPQGDFGLGEREGGLCGAFTVDIDHEPGQPDEPVRYDLVAQTCSRYGVAAAALFTVNTPTGGSHLHGRCKVPPSFYGGQSCKKLVGVSGELRFGRRSMTVLPPTPDYTEYLKYGSLDDPLDVPIELLEALVSETNIPAILSAVENDQSEVLATTALPPLGSKGPMPRKTERMLKTGYADPYDDDYASNSEFEQAIIQGLVNKNFSYEDVRDVFFNHAKYGYAEPQHYWQKAREEGPAAADKWLSHSYDKALSRKEQGSKAWQVAVALSNNIPSCIGRGQSKTNQEAILRYLADRAVAAGTPTDLAVSYRDIMQGTTISAIKTVSKNITQLENQGFISVRRPNEKLFANIYDIHWSVSDAVGTKADTSSRLGGGRSVCFCTHDAFHRDALGELAGCIWSTLLEYGPLTLAEISTRLSRNKKRVAQKLRDMERGYLLKVRHGQRVEKPILDQVTGELFRLVERVDGKYVALDVDLDHIARVLGTEGVGVRQRERIDRERAAHRESLRRGANHDQPVQDPETLLEKEQAADKAAAERRRRGAETR